MKPNQRTLLKYRLGLQPISSPSAPCFFWLLFFILFYGPSTSHAAPSDLKEVRYKNPLNIDWDPAPPPEKGPPASAGAIRDPAYLPYQIGAIVASYGVSLVLVAVSLLVLSKRRREALSAGDREVDIDETKAAPMLRLRVPSSLRSISASPLRNLSCPAAEEYQTPESATPQTPYITPTPTSISQAPGADLAVDQHVVAEDRDMAQTQLEEMYKYVMEQEEARLQGIVLEGPVGLSSRTVPLATRSSCRVPAAAAPSNTSHTTSFIQSTGKKEKKHKPGKLDLGGGKSGEKKPSRASALFAAFDSLRSPRRSKGAKAMDISSPILTPVTATFPRQEYQELSAMPQRQYTPPSALYSHMPYGSVRHLHGQVSPISPDQSPEGMGSMDDRLSRQVPMGGQVGRGAAGWPERERGSTLSERSMARMVGLPQSPKPGAQVSYSVPPSPMARSFFQVPETSSGGGEFRSKAPSAVRTGGALPLRAFEPPPSSPSPASQTATRQTIFTRPGPLSPVGARTPTTTMAVPYSPYQPFTPIMPMTPSLVTKADRKKKKKREPKTPTLKMVESDDELWG